MYTEQQLQHQNELKSAREREERRKKRTQRLIQHGAIAESFVPGSDRMDENVFRGTLAMMISPRRASASANGGQITSN